MSTKQLTQPSKEDLEWFGKKPALYDIHKTYMDNLLDGPIFNEPLPTRIMPPEDTWIDFLGHKIASPLGIPAGPLLSSSWIDLAAKLGFDVLTYKTIRSTQYSAHPLPNMIYVKTGGDVMQDNPDTPAIRTLIPPTSPLDLSVTNSFGNPSMTPEFLIEDIAKANSCLKPGQIMMVSVYGYPHDGKDSLQDFVDTARFAKEAGAKIIEANFSCPNVDANEGCLYMTPDLVYTLSKRIKDAIGDTPLVIKVGLFPNKELMREVLIAAARAGVEGFCGINTIKMKAINEDGSAALGENRLHCGVCGSPIRKAALSFARDATQIIRKEKLPLTLIMTGGVTSAEHFTDFLDAGASVSMSAAGMMWDPMLAINYHKTQGENV